MAATKMSFDPSKPLSDLAVIVKQVEQAKDVDRTARSQAGMWASMADRFDEAATGSSADEGRREKAALYHKAAQGLTGLSEAAELCRSIATKLNPVAEVNWTRETVEDLLVGVRFFMSVGAYEGEQLAEAQSIIEKAATLTKTRVPGTGGRGEGRTIEGRPERVQVISLVGDTPETITEQAGNKESAPGNIKKSITVWLEKHDIVVTDEMSAQIGDAISACVRDGQSEAKIGDFALIRQA